MAPDPQSMMFSAGLLQFPQLFLAVSAAFPLLLILVVIVCAFCRRFSERIRSCDGQLKAIFIKNHTGSVRLRHDLETTNENGVVPGIVDQQLVRVNDKCQVVQNIPSIQMTNLAGSDMDNDDGLYEVVRDIHVNVWNSNEGSLSEQKLDYMTQYEKMPSAESSRKIDYNTEVKESTNAQLQTPIYAKIVKHRNKECKPQVQEKPEVGDEGNVDEPPPIPDKHLDDEDSAPW
ncbi:uncharacterized protein LOC127581819 [Pristis pectinata]|uniref:uncharacterized protein LOC127581819 n=1 Tax=Pristis pectinata TaxID=685728 RepID=UPI00223DC4AE|nr:uncharacterized protein LOC127581819 [Pristis pectinata]XP_051892529.1 uncharacterized protein LOC127581819 [Pristis pectinata]